MRKVKGVESAEVDLGTGEATVKAAPDKVQPEQLIEAVEKNGSDGEHTFKAKVKEVRRANR